MYPSPLNKKVQNMQCQRSSLILEKSHIQCNIKLCSFKSLGLHLRRSVSVTHWEAHAINQSDPRLLNTWYPPLVNHQHRAIHGNNALLQFIFLWLTLQLRIVAFDETYPDNDVSKMITVRVTRNANAPRFSQASYTQRVSESFPIGGEIMTAVATDPDGVRYLVT